MTTPNEFIFSIVVPVFNVEAYLPEALDSVIAQNIGFDKCQLILVDDGSSDRSGEIIDQYARKYPDNIVAVHLAHGGVSRARNAGISMAQGKYVGYLDGDDRYSKNMLSKVYAFFEKNFDKIDLASCPIYMFGAKKGPHELNYKFPKKGCRIADLDKEPDAMQTMPGGAFMKRAAIPPDLYDPRLCMGEDTLANVLILLKRRTLGLVSGCKYYYRRREADGEPSAVQSTANRKPYFVDLMEYGVKEMIRVSRAQYGCVLRFVQCLVLTKIVSYLRKSSIAYAPLSKAEEQTFRENLLQALSVIDDDLIVSFRGKMSLINKIHALRLKYGVSPVLKPVPNNYLICLPENNPVTKISKTPIDLDFLTTDGDDIVLEGRFPRAAGIPDEGIGFSLGDGTRRFTAEIIEVYQDHRKGYSLDAVTAFFHVFKIRIPTSAWEGDLELRLFLDLKGTHVKLTNWHPHKYFPLTKAYASAYCVRNKVKVTLEGNQLRLSKRYSRVKSEIALIKEIWSAREPFYKRVALSRILHLLVKPLLPKPIWLVRDRAMTADDNGEAFYTYLAQKRPNIKAYFVLGKNSPAWAHLQKTCRPVDIDSLKYQILATLCDCFISSHGERDAWWDIPGLRDITAEKAMIFLQHGIIKDDLGDILRRQKCNFAGFVVSTDREYESIVRGNYGYPPENVWLTGMPRYDLLSDRSEKLVTVMPTWRNWLISGKANSANIQLQNGIADTDFGKFYSGLLTNKKLLDALAEHGYRLAFHPHPVLAKCIDQLNYAPQVEILGSDCSYRDIFRRSALMVTDYSSAIFDFAYLHKPVIYAQFDQETFTSRHYARGYFDYERDGFGHVESDLDSTVERIIECVRNGCQLEDRYRARIDAFFTFRDRENCRRVYDRIMAKLYGTKKSRR